MSYYTEDELLAMGWKRLGRAVRISRKASVYNAAGIEIGDESRVDDFCILSAGQGGIRLGRNVHVAAFSSLIGAGEIELQDFCNVSSRVSIYSSSDDYSGASMSNPTIPPEFTNVTRARVLIGKHVIIGAGSVILPGVVLHEGSGVGALSLVRHDCEPFGLYAGSPARRVGTRQTTMLEVEARFLASREPGLPD